MAFAHSRTVTGEGGPLSKDEFILCLCPRVVRLTIVLLSCFCYLLKSFGLNSHVTGIPHGLVTHVNHPKNKEKIKINTQHTSAMYFFEFFTGIASRVGTLSLLARTPTTAARAWARRADKTVWLFCRFRGKEIYVMIVPCNFNPNGVRSSAPRPTSVYRFALNGFNT